MNPEKMWETLQITQCGPHIQLVTLHRPEVRNAINVCMMQELLTFWQQLMLYPHDIRCIILTGSGEQAFCAGADLKERFNITTEVWKQQHYQLQMAFKAMSDCTIPIIAAVNGAAYGGGLELALASDFIYAVDSARFAQSEVKLGIMPGAMGTQNLPKACGIRRAKELSFTAKTFTAKEAFAWGMINKLCSPQQLLTEAIQTAECISENAPLAIRQVKKALNAALHLDLRSGYQFEVEAYNQLLDSEDRKEGIAAFNEKRTPHFKGK